MTYTFPFYFPAGAVLISLIALAAGIILILKKASLRAIIIAFFFAAMAGGVFAPLLFMDRVVLDEEKLEQTTGFWWSPSVKGFRLADVESVRMGKDRDRKNREFEVWIVRYKNGSIETIDPGDLWEMNGDDIRARLRLRGISAD